MSSSNLMGELSKQTKELKEKDKAQKKLEGSFNV